jgi:hypothetical protein
MQGDREYFVPKLQRNDNDQTDNMEYTRPRRVKCPSRFPTNHQSEITGDEKDPWMKSNRMHCFGLSLKSYLKVQVNTSFSVIMHMIMVSTAPSQRP